MSTSISISAKKQNNLAGISLMLMHAFAMSLLYAVIKELSEDLSSNLIVFLYKFSILILILPSCLKGGIKTLYTQRIWLHIARAFSSIAGSFAVFYAVKHIDLTDITALTYLEHVMVLMIGIIYFKEKATKTKTAVIITSLIGAWVIVCPDMFRFEGSIVPVFFANRELSQINPYYGYVIIAMVAFALNCAFAKELGKTDKVRVQMFYAMFLGSIMAFPVALMHWVEFPVMGSFDIKWPERMLAWEELGLKTSHISYMTVIVLCYFVHNVGLLKSLKLAELSVVIPFEYSRLVFAGVLGYVMFSEVPTTSSYFGYALIVGAGIYLIRYEARKKRKLKARELETQYDTA